MKYCKIPIISPGLILILSKRLFGGLIINNYYIQEGFFLEGGEGINTCTYDNTKINYVNYG